MANTLFGIIELANHDDPLANRKSARLFAADLPANDPVGAVEAVTALLEAPSSARHPIDLAAAQAILELDRIVSPLHAQLRAQYRLTTVSEDVRQRLWRACDRVARAFASIYERVCEALVPLAADNKTRAALHGAFTRLFFYIGVQARHGLFRYERWIPGRWTTLHQAYSEACRQGVVAESYVLDRAAQADSQLSPEQEYLQVLLLHLLNTGNLSAQQIDRAAEWLGDWVTLLRLAIKQPEGEGYWLDLGQGDGLIAHQPEQSAGELLYLDVNPLAAKLAELTSQLAAEAAGAPAAGATSAQPGEPDYDIELAGRLAVLWSPQAPQISRRGERHTEQKSVTVALGWAEIAPALTLSALQRSSAPAGYHYDDYGRLQPNRPGMIPAAESRKPDLNVWQIHDVSDSGYRIRTSVQQGGKMRLGWLLALRVEGEMRWQLGIVRRLKRLNSDQIELGVEVISRAVTLIAPKSVAARNLGYSVDGIDVGQKGESFNALFLPGQSRARSGSRPSLVLPPPEFTVGRTLSLVIDGHNYDVALAPPLERTKDWVWTPLELGDWSA
ncbi:MAG: hypothetical protein ABJB04_00315 [Betaproteobacteria bacterium]